MANNLFVKTSQIPTPQIFHQNSLNIQNKKLAVSLILREFEWCIKFNWDSEYLHDYLIYLDL